MSTTLIFNGNLIPLTGQGVIENGALLIKDGIIAQVFKGPLPDIKATYKIDAAGMYILPGLTDCHTHLMEYAAGEIHKAQGKAQKMAGIANLLTSLKSGVTNLGEHCLGHFAFTQTIRDYQEIADSLPLNVRLACGCCFIGTEPLALVSSTRPAQVIKKTELTAEDYYLMASASDFPGENIFINATVASLPLSAAPRAGEITFSYEEIKKIVEIFHSAGKKIGAHIEGDEAALMFIRAGGDVIHHGHNLSPHLADLMRENKVDLVVTPHAGTSAKPTSPVEVLHFHERGVKVALASDSYIPVHPEAEWTDLPSGYLAGPEDFMTICQPIAKHFLDKGVSLEDTLKLFTINGCEILSLENVGSFSPGDKGNVIICDKIPVIETTDPSSVKCVVYEGEVIIQK